MTRRQSQGECRAAARRLPAPDTAAVIAGGLGHDAQPESAPGALLVRAGPCETLEDSLTIFTGDPRSVVLDVDVDHADARDDTASGKSSTVNVGVVEEVGQRSAELGQVCQ